MQLTSILLNTLATATAVLARPTSTPAPDDNTISRPSGWQPWNCLSDGQAAHIIATFAQILRTGGNDSVTFNSLLDSIANPDDAEFSDSLNFFTGLPVGSVSESSRAMTEIGHLSQGAGFYEVGTLNIWHSCNIITWRYNLTIFPGATPVNSILVLVLGANGKIDTTYYEFNSAIWAQNLGYVVIPPANSSSR